MQLSCGNNIWKVLEFGLEGKQKMIHLDIFCGGGCSFYFHAMIKPLNIDISVDLAWVKQHTEKIQDFMQLWKIGQFPTHSVREITTKLHNKCLKHCDVLKFSNVDKINHLIFSYCNQIESLYLLEHSRAKCWTLKIAIEKLK